MMFKNRAACGMLLLFSLWFNGSTFAAAGEKFNANGYRFDISADQFGDALSVRGRVSGGDRCKKLTIKIVFYNENNDRVRVVAVVNNYNGNERFSLKKAIDRYGSRWRVADVYVSKYK